MTLVLVAILLVVLVALGTSGRRSRARMGSSPRGGMRMYEEEYRQREEEDFELEVYEDHY